MKPTDSGFRVARNYKNRFLELLHHDAGFSSPELWNHKITYLKPPNLQSQHRQKKRQINFTTFIWVPPAYVTFIIEPEFSLTITSPNLLESLFRVTLTHLCEYLCPSLLDGCNKAKSKAIHICDQLHKITFYDTFKHIALIFVFQKLPLTCS